MAEAERTERSGLHAIVIDCVNETESKQDAARKLLTLVRDDEDLYSTLIGPYEMTAALDMQSATC